MRKILLISIAVFTILSCKHEDSEFEVNMPLEGISFKPIHGGAVMYYNIPDNSEVFSIKAEYLDAYGRQLSCVGSYVSDSIVLSGFNESRKDVPVAIYLMDRSNRMSKALMTTFSTLDSGPYSFFDKVDVSPFWDGFTVRYKEHEPSNGLMHVFYIGKNPFDKSMDTLIMGTYPLTAKSDTIHYTLKSDYDKNTVVIRTEDARGFRVKEVTYKDIDAYRTEKLEPSEFDFLDPYNLTLENTQYSVGLKYLFDGDTKGTQDFLQQTITGWAGTHNYIAGPQAIGKPFVIDLRNATTASSVRMYVMLSCQLYSRWNVGLAIWNGFYITKVANDVSVYGSNTPNITADLENPAAWDLVASYQQSRMTPYANRWCARAPGGKSNTQQYKTLEAINDAPPCFLPLDIPVAKAKPYRYLKMVINDTYADSATPPSQVNNNPDKYVTFSELEVYVKVE